jgi:putative inorganic carbon (hco3(-)) transporter
MSKTAFVWAIGLLTGTVLSFRDPIFGLLAYLWEYYNHPPLRWWGNEVPDWRWSLIVALVLFVSYSLEGKSIFRREIFRHRSTQWLTIFLGISIVVTGLLAVDPVRSRDYVLDLAKLALLFCLIVGVIDDYKKYQWVVIALILGAFHWGLNAYINPHFDAGRLVRIGGPDSVDDNAAAAHVITALPFLALYFWHGNKWQRIVAIIAAPFIVNLIILCNSRGATIGMILALVAGVVLMDWRLRLRLAFVALLFVPLALTLVDQNFIDRQLTLVTFVEEGPQSQAVGNDGAANERLLSWAGAVKLIGERPLGVGGGGYDLLSPIYAPTVVEAHQGEPRAVHNTFLWAASDWGVPGAIAFVGFIGAGLLSLHRIRRQTMSERLKLESLALEVALIAFLGASVFVNRMYAEVLYWLVAMSAALTNIHDAEAAQGSLDDAPRAARAA